MFLLSMPWNEIFSYVNPFLNYSRWTKITQWWHGLLKGVFTTKKKLQKDSIFCNLIFFLEFIESTFFVIIKLLKKHLPCGFNSMHQSSTWLLKVLLKVFEKSLEWNPFTWRNLKMKWHWKQFFYSVIRW